MKVLKFGGSSVADAENIKKVLTIVDKEYTKTKNLVVVVSALRGVTDALLSTASLASLRKKEYEGKFKKIIQQHTVAAKTLTRGASLKRALTYIDVLRTELEDTLKGVYLTQEISLKTHDAIISFGERLSSYIIAEAFQNTRVPAIFVDSRTIIKTDENFGDANVIVPATYKLVHEALKRQKGVVVLGGFISSTLDGISTTLGRGGSDYTASLIGAALDADVIEIWTDVDGVLTADPRKVKNAFPLKTISYEEAGELAHFGAKVVHPKTMKPARLKKIPIFIKNTFNSTDNGTCITTRSKSKALYPISGISSLGNVALIQIKSYEREIELIASKLFNTLSKNDVRVLLTTQASYEQSFSLAIAAMDLKKTRRLIEKELELEIETRQIAPLTVKENLSIVAIVGNGMKGVPGISGKFLKALGDAQVNIVAIAQGSSELNISVVIDSKDESKSLYTIHENFFYEKQKEANVFLVGTGLIGGTVLKQIAESNLPIQVCGILDVNHGLVSISGIDVSHWKKVLGKSKPMSLDAFISAMNTLPLPYKVFVDCTASDDVALTYESILRSGVAVVTPNKKANSGKLKVYKTLHDIVQKQEVPFLYETNVGAALPVISTVKDLVHNGDSVVSIEAVLSGTLSYIFNTYADEDVPFSELVLDAQKQGYTEPDPRDDLNGMDVARKILILAREVGYDFEMKDIIVTPFLPLSCFKASSVTKFYQELKKADDVLYKQKLSAQKQGKKLRYVASLKKGKATVSLQAVDEKSAFYGLDGSDNLVAIMTKRYNKTPLVIRGPGAGAEVTAGGVVSDILRINRFG